MRLGITGNPRTTLQSTNAIELMISILRRTSRNVKRWQSGDMCLRWTAAGMLEAEQQFRRIICYSCLARLALAVERDVAASRSSTTVLRSPSGQLRSSPPDHQPADRHREVSQLAGHRHVPARRSLQELSVRVRSCYH